MSFLESCTANERCQKVLEQWWSTGRQKCWQLTPPPRWVSAIKIHTFGSAHENDHNGTVGLCMTILATEHKWSNIIHLLVYLFTCTSLYKGCNDWFMSMHLTVLATTWATRWMHSIVGQAWTSVYAAVACVWLIRMWLNLRPQNIMQKVHTCVQHSNCESGVAIIKFAAHRLVQYMLQVMWRWHRQMKHSSHLFLTRYA